MKHGLAALVVLLGACGAQARQLPKDTFTDPDKAGPDFAVQGEYEGLLAGKEKFGAQVVAEGKGMFKVVFFKGGLPGAGWDGKMRVQTRGRTVDGKTLVDGAGWKAEIAGDKFAIVTPEGAGFEAKRVLRKSPTEGLTPPAGAVVLFDGSGVGEWTGGKLVEDKLLGPGATTKKKFRDFTLHVEFRLPFRPLARGQGRANSGVYLQGRYEIQILDSFGVVAKNNDCGAIYEKTPPTVNVCFPPLSWQTYDIEFRAARFTAGKKTANAVVTVKHNGIVIHDKAEIPSQTGFGRKEEDTPGPINLQNHGNPVYFRNIWLVAREP